MHLSDDQIQYLFQFTEKKLVRWYDLQIELVDHLASRIEEEMEMDKSLFSEVALQKVYKDFGLFGFAKVVQEKQEQLHRSARTIWWQEMRAYFTWPKIILVALIFMVLWTLSTIIDPYILMLALVAAYTLSSVVLLIKMYGNGKAHKKLLLLQFGTSYVSSAVFFYEILLFLSVKGIAPVLFCLYAIIGILIKMSSFNLYYKIKQKAFQLYPAAFA